MAQAAMTLHKGGREVSLEELTAVPCPEPSGIWRPVPHSTVLKYAKQALQGAGYEIEKMRLGLSSDDQRFWGTMVLQNRVVQGVSLAVAIASSLDKSLSLRWGYGHNVWICDNGAWSTQKTIARKHTTHAVDRYLEAIQRCVGELEQYREVESERINRMITRECTDYMAESFLLRCYQDEGILSPRNLPVALKEWREPSFHDFDQKNVWRLFNACTFALQPRRSNPQAHASATIRLGHLLADEAPTASVVGSTDS